MHMGSVGPTRPFLSHRDFDVEDQMVGPLWSQNLLGYSCLSPPKHSSFSFSFDDEEEGGLKTLLDL
jgi:hypothetical protein